MTTPKGFKAAYDAYVAGGWMGLSMPEAFGGQGLPTTLNVILQEFQSSANLALAMYPGLTQGAIAALLQHGSEEVKQTYVPKMVAGTWTGTMNLTEPHCGTDLGSSQDQGRAERRRLLCDHRHQDLHLVGRA